jgi:hypothetical protein
MNHNPSVNLPVAEAQKEITDAVSLWEGVEVSPHRFGGIEFSMGRRELGHIHGNYQADIPFPKTVRDKLVSEKRVEPHHIMPRSGWITFRFRKKEDVQKAFELFRESYELALKSIQVGPAGPR